MAAGLKRATYCVVAPETVLAHVESTLGRHTLRIFDRFYANMAFVEALKNIYIVTTTNPR